MELTARARAMQEMSFQVFEAFTAATVIYIVINIAVTYGMRWIERYAAVPGLIGAGPLTRGGSRISPVTVASSPAPSRIMRSCETSSVSSARTRGSIMC